MNNKKIAIDNLALSSGHSVRGVGVYTNNLTRELVKVKSEFRIESISFSQSKKNLSSYDLIHYPYFDIFYHSLPIIKNSKVVVTVHDTIPLLYPDRYPAGVRGKVNFYLQKLALRNVDAVITISETSKKDIVRFLDIPKEKIFTIYEAPNFIVKKSAKSELENARKRFKLPEQFVLYIGDVNYNKNLVNLAKAIKQANLKLVIVGKQALENNYDKTHVENKPLVELQKKFGNDKDIIRLGYLENNDLNLVWQLATVYCQPSLYEGFGLSIVEAMQAEVPVACSKTQALVEVAGDAAEYFDPKDTNDMAEKIKKVFVDKKLKESLIKKGKERVKIYSWKKAAEETISVYKSVLQEISSDEK